MVVSCVPVQSCIQLVTICKEGDSFWWLLIANGLLDMPAGCQKVQDAQYKQVGIMFMVFVGFASLL